MTIQPARHECRACCLLRAGFLTYQPVMDNTRSTRVGQVVSFQKILRGSQLTWNISHVSRAAYLEKITMHLTDCQISLFPNWAACSRMIPCSAF